MPGEPSPTERRQDIAQTLIRAGVSLVPGGSAINELLNLVIVPAVAERQRRWLEALDHELGKLRERMEGFSFDDLQRREDFASAFLRASRIAATTHRKEKLQALCNAVLNVAIGDAPDDDLQVVFLSLIEAYTPLHLRLLAFMDDPSRWTSERGAFKKLHVGAHHLGYDQILEGVFPGLKGRRRFYDQVLSVLERDALISDVPAGATVHVGADGECNIGFRRMLTPEGREFLRFVTAPDAISG
jgi:hypothetical protein